MPLKEAEKEAVQRKILNSALPDSHLHVKFLNENETHYLTLKIFLEDKDEKRFLQYVETQLRPEKAPGALDINAQTSSRTRKLRSFTPVEQDSRLAQVLENSEAFTKEAWANFLKFDKNQDKCLDLQEVKQLVQRLCHNFNVTIDLQDENALWQRMQHFDRSGDGKLQFQEFVEMFRELVREVGEALERSKQRVPELNSSSSSGSTHYPNSRRQDGSAAGGSSPNASMMNGFPGKKRSGLGGMRSVPIVQLQNRRIEEYYEIEDEVGHGKFGRVFAARQKSSGALHICKVIVKKTNDVSIADMEHLIQVEVEIMRSLDHPHIIKVLQVFENETYAYIIMETCEGETLLRATWHRLFKEKRICPFSEDEASRIIGQLLSALAHAHHNRVVHKDVKPENIIFVQKDYGEVQKDFASPIKLIDFGLAERIPPDRSHCRKRGGTLQYFPPEVFGEKSRLDFKCDVWAAGVVLYILLTGAMPFVPVKPKNDHETQQLIRDITEGTPDALKPSPRNLTWLSADAIDLLKRMLNKDPSERPHATELLSHPWLRRVRQKHDEASPAITPELLARMRAYTRDSELRKALKYLIAHSLDLKLPVVQEIWRAFDQVDRGVPDGALSVRELSTALRQAGAPETEIHQIIEALDVTKDNSVEFTEFLAACLPWRRESMEELKAEVMSAFYTLDTDGDQQVTRDEFALGLFKCHYMSLHPRQKYLIGLIDKDGDHVIQAAEYWAYVDRLCRELSENAIDDTQIVQ